ncbi:hypothetical protein MKX03_021829, partial [Papaver bracteatum]
MAQIIASGLHIMMTKPSVNSSRKVLNSSAAVFVKPLSCNIISTQSKSSKVITREMSQSTDSKPTLPSFPIDLRGKRAFIAGIDDDNGYGWAIEKSLAAAGAEILVGTWVSALHIFETSLCRGKFDAYRVLQDRSLMEITKVYPLDAVFDNPKDVPEDLSISLRFGLCRLKKNKRYAGSSNWTVQDFGSIDILVHSLANGLEVCKPLLETFRKGYLAAISASSYSYVSFLNHFIPIMNPGKRGASLSLTYIASERIIPGGISMAVDSVVTNLKSRTRMISTSEEIAQVGTISSNGDRDIGEMIAKAMEKVGKDGVITITTLNNEIEVVEGMKLDRGYISPYFITNQKNHKCELEDPLILIHEKKISSINYVVKVLELALKRQRTLLIVAEDIESDALATLILNNLRAGIKVCAIKAPGFGENMKYSVQDLVVLTGGEACSFFLLTTICPICVLHLITEELGMNLEKVELEMLGTSNKVTISKDDTVVLDGAGDNKFIEEPCEQLRVGVEMRTYDYDKDKLQERLANLSGGVSVLKVSSEAEVGGGIALLYASRELEKLEKANFDQKIGVQVIQNAFY